MYIQEISIHINTDVDRDELINEFDLLMAFYRSSGQIQGKIESRYIKDNKVICLPFTLEENALDRIFDNFYVSRQTKIVEELCNAGLSYRTVGKSYESYTSACKCQKPDFYMLITNYLTIESPVVCGTCHNSVPLYKLPPYYDHGYKPILNWETNYVSCDSLQMNCQVGERWALNQMEELNSQLSRQGMQICRKIEELTAIPVYYYLHNYKKYKGDQLSRPCPGCQKKWDLKTQLHNHYNFMCDNCRIISTISPNA